MFVGHFAIGFGAVTMHRLERMVERTVAEFGRLDAAFNNAGVMARIAPTAWARPSP